MGLLTCRPNRDDCSARATWSAPSAARLLIRGGMSRVATHLEPASSRLSFRCQKWASCSLGLVDDDNSSPTEGAITFLLLIKIGPLRELVIKSLDQMKMGKGPATVKTIAGTMAVILFSNLMSIVKIQNKGAKLGTMSPMDQVLWRTHLLEASLMGVVLFLGFVIDRMHHYMRKLINIRCNVGSSKEELEQLRKERTELKEKEEKASKEIKQLQEKVSSMSERLKKAETESKEKEKKVEAAETHVTDLQKQSAELLLEYDRLLEDNEKLQSQILGNTKS